jgi:hypothetical protein
MATVEEHLLGRLRVNSWRHVKVSEIPRLFGFEYGARAIDELGMDSPYLDEAEFKLCK